MTAQAAEFFRFFPQVPLHFVERLRRVHDRITAPPLHLLDLLEHLDQLVRLVTDEV